jgi:hypothetical protein
MGDIDVPIQCRVRLIESKKEKIADVVMPGKPKSE